MNTSADHHTPAVMLTPAHRALIRAIAEHIAREHIAQHSTSSPGHSRSVQQQRGAA